MPVVVVTDNGLLVLYRAYFLYGFGRMVSWFLYARFDVKVPWQPVWGGPNYVKGNHLMTQSWQHILISISIDPCWEA